MGGKGKGGGVDGWNMNECENDCGTENVKRIKKSLCFHIIHKKYL